MSPSAPGDAVPEPGQDVEPAAPVPSDHDAGRRQFFRLFGKQAIQTVTQVAGVASAVSQMPTNAAAGLMGLGLGDPRQNAAAISAGAAAARPAAAVTTAAAYRSPYRVDGQVLYLVDQRRLPDTLEEQTCRRGSDVAFYIRAAAARGGPLLAQLAAYGLAMTARESAERSAPQRAAELRRVTRAIAVSRGGARMLEWALDHLNQIAESLGSDATGDAVATALREAADALAMEAQADHARIAQEVAALLPRPEGRPLHVLVHGDPGSCTSGMLGTALNGLALRAAEGAGVQVWVTETRPYLEGARLATWELTNAGIEHTLLPDSAVASLLDAESIDAVLLGAEWIAANGDTANVIGSRAVAELAAGALRGPAPVYVCAPMTTFDPDTADGAAIPHDVRPARELGTYLTGVCMDRQRGYNPGADVVPARRITAFVTEMGVLFPTDPAALRAAAQERAARRVIPTAPVPVLTVVD